ncbi:MAG: hypothetical protein ACEQSR_15800, partial [Candidatus Methylacidiphilales bacterium]
QGADLVAFGRPFIANPDLSARLRQGGPFNTPDRKTFYGGSTARFGVKRVGRWTNSKIMFAFPIIAIMNS